MAVQSWVAESLSLPLAPGREADWTAVAAQALRSDPTASVEQVTARALASVHGLAPEAARDVEALLAGRPIDSFSGGNVSAVVGAGKDAYAFAGGGLLRRTASDWERLQAGVSKSKGFAVEGGRLYAGDGSDVYEFQGGAKKKIIEGGVATLGPLIRHQGKAYLGVWGDRIGLYAESDGEWKPVPGSTAAGSPESMAEHQGALYLAGSHGLYRQDGETWTPVLTRLGAVFGLISHDGKLYAQYADSDGNHHGLEITGWAASELFEEGTRIDWLFPHDGRLYAARPMFDLYERLASGWRRVLEHATRPSRALVATGRELFVGAADGLYHRDGDGPWNKIGDYSNNFWAPEADHAGRTYLSTEQGLAVAGGGRVQVVVPGFTDIIGMASHGDELLIATPTGVKRLVTNPPPGWRDALLEAFQSALEQAASLPAPDAPVLRDRGGRPLLGLGVQTAPPPPAEPWGALSRWLSRALGRPLAPDPAAWAAAARERLRSAPTLPLEAALADGLADAAGLAPGERDAVAAVLDSRWAPLSLPDAKVDDLMRVGGTVYAFTQSGLFARVGDKWSLLHPGVRAGYGRYEIGGALYVGDGELVYAVRGAEVESTGVKIRHFGPIVEHAGALYMATSGVAQDVPLWIDDGSGWKPAPGAEDLGGTGSLVEMDGALYAGSPKGVFALEVGRWINRLPDAGNASWLTAFDGKIYARVEKSTGDPRFSPTEYRLYELDATTSKPALGDKGAVRSVWAEGERLYAQMMGGEMFLRTPSKDWEMVFEPSLSRVRWGDTVLTQTQEGIYRRDGDGPWRPVYPGNVWLGDMLEHEGRRYLATGGGLLRVDPDELRPVLAGTHVHGIVAEGRDLWLGTDEGVARLVFPGDDLHADWREEALRQMEQSLAAPASPKPSPRSLTNDAKGRPLLGLTTGGSR